MGVEDISLKDYERPSENELPNPVYALNLPPPLLNEDMRPYSGRDFGSH